MTLRREVKFTPAYDKRDPDPAKNYGVRGVTLTFYVHGEKGAVQFVIYTNWMTPEVQKEIDAQLPDGRFPWLLHEPMPADLGYHSRKPLYEDQHGRSDCDLLGGECYYDGSTLNAERLMDTLRLEGDEGVWRELEAYYFQTFGVRE